MIELTAFQAQGLKSLHNSGQIPVRAPTIITGANDGGKSTTLQALAFLLGGPPPSLHDYTLLGAPADGETEPIHSETVIVEGTFRLGTADSADLSLGRETKVRRKASFGGGTEYEMLGRRPVDPRLREIETRPLNDLKALVGELGLQPSGPRNQKASWLGPLQLHIASQEFEDAWIPAPRELTGRLPLFAHFSSTEEPDPERQIREALRTAFRELLDDDELIGPVREVEGQVRERLVAKKAKSLCEHVALRCPELSSISINPEVQFSEGFQSVQVMTARPNAAPIALNQSGAGRRRRINLAVWEWTGELLSNRSTDDRALVIAYDEPDTHLDYGHQRELVSLIRKQCETRGVRMVVATHSLNLIDRVAIEDVVHLRLENEHTIAERLIATEHEDIQRYLAGVSEAMGLRNSVLLHERCFVGVEGPTETQALPVLFRLVTGMSLQSAGVALLSGNGNDGALRVVQFLKENGRRLAFLLVDADSADGKIFRPDKLRAAGVTDEEIRFLGDRELEDLFSDSQWTHAANRDWPRADGRQWADEDFVRLRAAPKFSRAIEEMVREGSLKAPQGKPGYLTALVQGMVQEEEVPTELAGALRDLAAFAAG